MDPSVIENLPDFTSKDECNPITVTDIGSVSRSAVDVHQLFGDGGAGNCLPEDAI